MELLGLMKAKPDVGKDKMAHHPLPLRDSRLDHFVLL
jgi:hypothetical protein